MMSQFFSIHPENPQLRLIRQSVEIVRKGGLIIFPTDSAYALGCHLGDKKALDKIRMIRQLSKEHNFTLMCRDLSELSLYAKIDNQLYRSLKAHTPGPYTFILEGTPEVPRRLLHQKRKTIGLRIPKSQVALALLEELGEPIMSVSLIMPGDDYPLTDPHDMRSMLEHSVDLIIDGGYCGLESTTVVDFSGAYPEITRQGIGKFEDFAP
jgi:tRNA threonylcarbamoyl adenosine modification protein (Sua5/YciO/YrdC/YwlC family)